MAVSIATTAALRVTIMEHLDGVAASEPPPRGAHTSASSITGGR
ncbi:MAG: hypothetical protein P8R54_12815 [Myxococcota bacterium]|nr:hypothetical protein [Myxococcota bacterium]